ncbi:AI-2E family transporter [Intestinimonas butyriciproducens]|uniref:AI-2E family transporter n=1 Tax=Intestinimonas butyriciproducens TaxID=1297617 RepID=UPI00195A63DE|nr:AI-2E family transporter [Intestinimonas butyriciproducens]
MELNRDNLKKILGIIAFTVLLYAALQRWEMIAAGLQTAFGYVFPFVLGACVAFVLNVPMRFIEIRIIEKWIKDPKNYLYKNRRAISLVITLILVAGVLFFVFFQVVPALVDTIGTVIEQSQVAIQALQRWAYQLGDRYPDIAQKITQQITEIRLDWDEIIQKVGTWLRSAGSQVVTSTIGVATSVAGKVVNFFLALIFSFYVLMQKEKLSRQCKQLLYAFLPEKVVERFLHIASLSSLTFARFLSGQCLEACILGGMFFVAMTLLGFPYALLIGVLIAFTALIPIFGAMIGLVVGAFLLLMVEPVKALWFIVLFFILQQLEGNLIYPHVVGNSVGLPSIWVLVAVTVGGNAMGIPGMLLFIPISSVIYALLREDVYGRLRRRYGDRAQALTVVNPPVMPRRKRKPKDPPGKGV